MVARIKRMVHTMPMVDPGGVYGGRRSERYQAMLADVMEPPIIAVAMVMRGMSKYGKYMC